MFGIGFTELLLISIIAILFLGPDKLPEALVEMAKFIKSVKKTIGDAKDSLEEELKISDLKEEALSYKKQLNSAADELKGFKNLDLDDISYDDEVSTEKPKAKKETPYAERKAIETPVETKSDTVTFKKEKKIAKNNDNDNKDDA